MSANNLLFSTYIGARLTTRAGFWKIAKRISFFSPFVLTAILYPFVWKNLGFDQIRLTFSLSVSFIALILAGTYFFSYKFFGENFYYFIFVSWITNAIYLIPELNGPEITSPAFPLFKTTVIGLSLTSTAFLVLALLTRAQNEHSKPTWREIPNRSYLTVGILTIFYIGMSSLCLWYAVPQDIKATIAKWMLPSSAISFFLLWAVGTSLKLRLKRLSPSWIGGTLWGSFFVYALLQFTYPYTLYMTNHLPLFLVAQLVKVVNAIAMTGALQSAMVHKEAMQNEQILRAEQEVEVTQAQLTAQEEKLRSRENFVQLGMLASAIKHDVVTPLATMGFDLDALRHQFQHNEISTRRLDSLNESKDRIEAIVKIVDIFRGDKAFFDRDQFMTKASMLEIAHRAVRSVKNELPKLKQEKPPVRLKITGRDVWIRAYVPMLEQVLVNVIKNGIEAIEEAGRESGRIFVNVVSVERENTLYSRWVKAEVTDNGCGIPQENLSKLTSIFTTRSHKKPNSGIGLFIGNRILEIHNGEFDFKSTPGEGTIVTLLLPEFNALERAEQGAVSETKGGREKSHTEDVHTTADSLHNSKSPNRDRSAATPKEQNVHHAVAVDETLKSGEQQ